MNDLPKFTINKLQDEGIEILRIVITYKGKSDSGAIESKYKHMSFQLEEDDSINRETLSIALIQLYNHVSADVTEPDFYEAWGKAKEEYSFLD